MTDTSTTRPPRCSAYYGAILKILKSSTERTPDVFVPHHDVVLAVVREMGYDPDNLAQYGDPALGWRLGGPSKPYGMNRLVCVAFGQMIRKKIPLCSYGENRGQWGLTKAGIKAFLPVKRTENATARFLEKRLAARGGIQHSQLYKVMFTTVAHRLPVSYASGQVEDHIMQYLGRLIRRDALRAWLVKGGKISNNRVAGFAINSAFTDIRDSARNPVCRMLYGAKTVLERVETPEVTCQETRGVTKTPAQVVRTTAGSSESALYEIVDLKPSIEEGIAFAAMWQEIEDALKARKPESWERLMQVLTLRFCGNSIREIKEEMGCSGNRATALLAEAKGLLRKVNSTRGFQTFDLGL